MDQNKRLILALAMSLAILFVFQEIYKPPRHNNIPTYPLQQNVDKGKPQESRINEIITDGAKANTKESPRQDVLLESSGLRATLTNEGAVISRIEVKDIVGDQLVNLVGTEEKRSKLFSITSDSLPYADTATYAVTNTNDSVEFTHVFGDIKVIKRYTISKDREEIMINLTFNNLSNLTKNLTYSVGGPSEVQETEEVKGSNFIEAAIDINGDVFRKNGVKGQIGKEGIISWVAISSRYFAVIMKPIDAMASFTLTQSKTESLSVSMISKNIAIPPQQEVNYEYILYSGPMIKGKLKEYNMGFEKVINYGFFGGVSSILIAILRFFYNWTHNWGIAIILLTALVNGISFPLTMKSFLSMKQMQSIQPHIEKLKELHKDNAQKLNTEVMGLYKKYNVNPFGGCLPMLLQIPIFIALYQGLVRAVELKGASFLWIKDLAQPEALKIPFTLPLIGNHINILPLAMLVLMVVQQKLQTFTPMSSMSKEQAQQQKIMMIMMPIFFGFIFYNVSSGLVLYWLTNTILMTGEQLYLKRAPIKK